jgi:Rps23 Pro-64 3,4-dihydroxylase Tpa1-like proline 4-hydroxylase
MLTYVNKILNSEKQPSIYDEKIFRKVYSIIMQSTSIRSIVNKSEIIPKLTEYLKRYNQNLSVHKGGNYVYVKNYGKRCVRLSNTGKKYIIIDGKRKYNID